MRVLIEDEDAQFYCSALRSEFPRVEFCLAATPKEVTARLPEFADIDVVFTKGINGAVEYLTRMPGLRWVQVLLSGTDQVASIIDSGSVLVTSARGVHGPQMAEAAITAMLALTRRLPRTVRDQDRKRWEPWRPPLLRDGKVAVVGLGAAGREIAMCCSALGMRVVAVSRTDPRIPALERVFRYDELASAVADVDFLVLTPRYSPETHHLVDASILRALPRSAMVVNLSRGAVVDEAALTKSLQAGELAGAALDVFTVEPLPHDSPLWDMENVLVTPHMGGRTQSYATQVLGVIRGNLSAYLAGNLDGIINQVSAIRSSIASE